MIAIKFNNNKDIMHTCVINNDLTTIKNEKYCFRKHLKKFTKIYCLFIDFFLNNQNLKL